MSEIAPAPATLGEFVSGDFISDAFDRAGRLAFCEARIARVVLYLESDSSLDRDYLLTLLRGALKECRREARQ